MAAKILLLDPPHKIFGGLRMWMPAPALMALAAYLESKDQTVDVIDATTHDRPWTDLESRLKEGCYEIVGITCSAATFHFDTLYTVRLVRSTLPDAIIVLGGGHVTLNAERIMTEWPELDYIVLGEGEETFLQLVKWIEGRHPAEPSDIAGLMYRRESKPHTTSRRSFMSDLDTLPMPAYHKVDLGHPTYYLHGMGQRAVGLSTSRGCGDRCSYCSESVLWHSTWRGRSGPLVVEEMQKLSRDYGKSLFVFNENSFNQSRERNEAFLESLGHSGLGCDFWFQSRVKDILRDRDLLDDFKRLGCYEVMLGVESILPEALHNYAKDQTLEQVREAAELLRSRGIMVMTNVMFGDIHDTEHTLKQIYDLVSEIGDFLLLTLTTPLPGTRYYQQMLKEERVEVHDFSCYDFMHAIMSNHAYTRDQIQALQKKYLKQYYTRPAIFLKMFFSPNPFIRMAYRLIMRFAWYEARNKEWVAKNYEEVPLSLKSEARNR